MLYKKLKWEVWKKRQEKATKTSEIEIWPTIIWIKYVEYWLIDSYDNSENRTGASSNIISEIGRQMKEF